MIMATPPASIPELEPLAAPQTSEERKERQRLHVKRTYYKKLNQMQSLRTSLHRLEQEFERLLAQKRAVDTANAQDEFHIAPDDIQSPASLRDEALAASTGLHTMQTLLTEILEVKERLRAENDALQRAIAKHERFSIKAASWMHLEDLATSSSDDDASVRARDPSAIRLARPIHVNTCRQIARQTYAEMQLFSQSPDFISTGVSVFGWHDKRVRLDDRIKFSLQKTFHGITPLELSLRGWAAIVMSNRFAQLYSVTMNVRVTTLQRVDDDNEIKLRVIASEDGTKLVKTLFLVSRFAISEDYVSVIRSLDPQSHLAPYTENEGVEEHWVDYYNWTSFQQDGDQGQHCRLIFGGEVQSNAVVGSETWMSEILLVALRWENLIVSPIISIAC